MMESQQKMLDQWMEMSKQMARPFWESVSPRATDAKNEDQPEKAGATDWMNFMSEFWNQWLSMMEQAADQNMKAYHEISGSVRNGNGLDLSKIWAESTRAWTDWLEQGRHENWPVTWSDWTRYWFKMWEEPLNKAAEADNNLFAMSAFQRPLFNLLESYPVEQQRNFLRQYNQFLTSYIEFADSIDLPFDEMASSWEKMLNYYAPREQMPLTILSENMSKYFGVMFYPLYGVVEPPHFIALLKIAYAIQFYTMAFLLRNAELRGLVLESTLSAWPRALQICNEELEQDGHTTTILHFCQTFLDKLEEHLEKLMKSKEYVQSQEKITEAMITLKANLNKWFEVSLAELPLVTQSDLNDIALEMEALRKKLREASGNKKKVGKKKNGVLAEQH